MKKKKPVRRRASARVPSHRRLGSTAASYTPGPWTTGSNGDHCAPGHAICSGPYVIAKVYGGGYPTGAGWAPRTQADANLIALAPELLDLLKDSFAALPPHSTLRKRARVLFARADGQS